MSEDAGKTSGATRLGYAATDTAGQLVFCFVSFYLLKFYTDTYGISPVAAGNIIFAARLIDAVDAPVWGIIFDRTHSRWGKYRPWFLWLCAPFALFGVLTFLTPDLGHNGKIIYAAVTYMVCGILYTGINTPVTSILSALTPSPRERVVLTCYRMFGSKLGVLFVNLTALRLVDYFGHGNDRKGFMTVMPMYAAGAVMLFLFAFKNLKEKVVEKRQTTPVLSGFGALKGNGPWLIIFASSLLFWIAFIARVSVTPYFFEYVLHRKDLISTANSLDFISLATAFLLPFFCRWTSKRNAWLAGLLGMVAGQLVVYLGMMNHMSVAWIMAGWALGFLASGMAMAMPFSVLSDSVDYGEWKTGIRAAGLLTAIGAAFCLKAGSGIGTALPAMIMQSHGYQANLEQTAESLRGITLACVVLPGIFFALAAVPVWFYGRYEKLEPQIRAELELRRNAVSAPA
jgi:sugar (glycoside-pentoside-hexuronide) transporter